MLQFKRIRHSRIEQTSLNLGISVIKVDNFSYSRDGIIAHKQSCDVFLHVVGYG